MQKQVQATTGSKLTKFYNYFKYLEPVNYSTNLLAYRLAYKVIT